MARRFATFFTEPTGLRDGWIILTTFRCPRCQSLIQAETVDGLRCPTCGFPGPDLRNPSTPIPAPQPMYSSSQPQSVARVAAPVYSPAYPNAPGHPGVQGKPRSFGISLLLVIVTIGIYAWVWNYKVFSELDRQHNREHEQVWFWLGLVPFIGMIFWWVYWSKEIRKLNEARQGHGLAPGISGLAMILWNTLGIFIIVGPFIGYYQLQKSINDVWRQVYQRAGAVYPKA